MRCGIHLIPLALSTACLAQETYKCSTPAGIVYQDRPCAGVKNTLKVEISSPPTAPSQDAASMDREKFYLEGRRIDKKRAAIADLQQEVSNLQRAMNGELAPLRQKWQDTRSNPNASTWESNALVARMNEVAGRYQLQIFQKQDQIQRLKQEIGLR